MSRPETVKLTRPEWVNLITAVVIEIGEANAKTILRRALGEERANLLIEKQEGPRLSKDDNRAIVKEFYDYAPGVTRDDKIAWAIKVGKSVFQDADRFAQILDYVEHRVAEHEALGGTLDKMPPSAEHVVKRITKWYGGQNYSDAILDPDYKLTVSPDGRHWNDAPASWRAGHAGVHIEDAVAACGMAYQQADGTWAGGKYEWHVRPPRPRSYENIKVGYNGWVAPPADTPVLFFAYTEDGNRVSEMAEGVYHP